ncbi:MAG: glutamate synthase (NADPH/NADH) large chain [bacterium]|jgi:glutamate synthase (NADPH/NADH) large chain
MGYKKKLVHGLPPETGLYNPAHEKDACGVGCIANKNGEKSHYIVESGIEILRNLQHRGAAGEDPLAGDGAGILTQIPHKFFKKALETESFDVPSSGEYGVGMLFLPPEEEKQAKFFELIEKIIKNEKQKVLGWRKVPSDNTCLSKNLLHVEPATFQVFVGKSSFDSEAFERKLYTIRKSIETAIFEADNLDGNEYFYACSFSSKTIVYKGMFLATQLDAYYSDLKDSSFTSAIALVHQRYSTNTFPTWALAQPMRYIAHNGEINTVQGNINWSRSRESQLDSELFGKDIKKLLPIIRLGQSDSASFDNFFELLVATGRNLDHAMMMMVPESWENDSNMDPAIRSFYEYHSAIQEPWDGPAALFFTNGTQIGGSLDRNGLRPVRYVETTDGFFIMASEVGVLEVPVERTKSKGRLGPGKMILIDTEKGQILKDTEIKEKISKKTPYQQWVKDNKISLNQLPAVGSVGQPSHEKLRLRQRVFGYTYEELHMLIKPMAVDGQETTYSMGNDTPLAVLSNQSKLLYNYFKQRFAQVTNPAIDSIREELVMSLKSNIGGGYNLLDETPKHCAMLEIEHPILTNAELEQLRIIKDGAFRSLNVDITFDKDEKTLEQAVDELCVTAEEAINEGYRLLVLSDRDFSEGRVPIPALLATSAVHHYLIRKNIRGRIGLIVESGEVREVHHCAVLIGYGAGAINPYLAFESIVELEMEGQLSGVKQRKAEENYIKALGKGLKKIFAKMGISTLASYQGAQIFEAVGLSSDLIEKYFTGTSSVVEGANVQILDEEIRTRHERAYAPEAGKFHKLLTGGDYHWRAQGEHHAYGPETVHLLQDAARNNSKAKYKEFAKVVNNQSKALSFLRGLFQFNQTELTPVPLEEVEPVSEIVKRFSTGAMSIGSISREAHETLAIAMNRLGGKSNTGEGGEDPARFTPDANGDHRRSKIKQVASGRFGVTSHYLVNADEIQIKVAQGAKPGEGGQLPGLKVNEYIGKLRNTIPGVTLISPPPHHDIYSIEDLSQLIFDLKNSNEEATISVKLVAETGVGTVAAGVSKANADHVTISGYDGGTGASPATSIKHAGGPWEIGLAETQQTLVMNNLRGQIRVQVDGQLKTGRDVIIGGLLGADEFGFATSALIATGCLLMRKCHLNTCPVGIATQDPTLRKNYTGKAADVVNYLTFIAEDVREIMAELGFRKFDELIGQVQYLQVDKGIHHWKAKGLDFSKIFVKPTSRESIYRHTKTQNHNIDEILDRELIEKAQPALENGTPVEFSIPVRNVNRTVGTMLGSKVSKKYGAEGLPDDTIKINLSGTAGQSFAAFVPKGITFTISGDANDYVGKGLSGGKLIIAPPEKATYVNEENMIVGNTVLYGATSGEAYFSGLAGERFAVRNSGAIAVVEGIGDHGCEYMTGGSVAILGHTGRNFAAGMSGGIAYVYDPDRKFKQNCNTSVVGLEKLIDEERVNELHGMIENHYKYTKSPKAKRILDNWSERKNDFVVVMPFEYRRILAKLEREKRVS